MRTQENIGIDMLPEFEFSQADTLKVKALTALDLKYRLNGRKSDEAVYSFCRITAQEVEPYIEQWEQMHGLVCAD